MNTELIQSLAKLAKVSDVEAFTAALQSESDTGFKLDTENLIVNTATELQTIKDNVYENAKKDTFKAAAEITIKNMKKETGLDFEGKDPKEFISKFKENILNEANIEPNNKIQELETSNSNLRNLLTEKESEISNIQESYKSESRMNTIKGLIPELPQGLGLTKDEAVSLVTLNLEFKEEGIYKNGELLKDKMESPLALDKYVENYVADKGWNKQPSGRGGGSGGQGSSAPTSLEEFNSSATEKGLRVGSQEYNALLNQAVKDNPSMLDQ